MKKVLLLIMSASILLACNSLKKMTKQEYSIINNGGENTDVAFMVLQTTNEEDSLFLRKKSTDISDIQEISKHKDWQYFLDRLKYTMAVESGVGIAAPQVGIARNIFLFTRIDKPTKDVQVAINPKIVNHSEETVCFEGDGCLSIPGQSGTSKRYKWIDVEYYTENGELIKERLHSGARTEDFTGVIFQHEFDHLQGILYIDKLCE